MPMIVSGLDPQVRMNAYLNGQQAQMQLKKQQDAMRQQMDQQREQYAMQMQQAMLKHKQEQARAAEDVNQRAQMGEAQAMEQQNMEAMAQKQPPEQKRLQEMSGVLSKITDPKARDYARDEFMRYEKDLRAEQQKQAAMQVIETAEKDELGQPGEAQQRMAAGEEPETIAKEYGERRKQRVAATIATTASADALGKADVIFSTLEPNTDIARRAQALIVAFQDSKTAQETPGAADRFLKQLDALIMADKQAQEAEKGPGLVQSVKTFSERGGFPALMWGAKQALGLGGQQAPQAAAPNIEQLKNSLRDTVVQIGNQTDDDMEFAKMLRDAGVPINAETQAAVRAIIEEEEARLAAGAGG